MFSLFLLVCILVYLFNYTFILFFLLPLDLLLSPYPSFLTNLPKSSPFHLKTGFSQEMENQSRKEPPNKLTEILLREYPAVPSFSKPRSTGKEDAQDTKD